MSLDLTTKGFSLANARELALYARMAYNGTPTIRSDKTDTNVLIRDLGEFLIIAFRGTTSLRNWITDCEFVRESIGDGQEVHSGFEAALSSILYQLQIFLTNSRKPVFITGHSLGAALAILLAHYLRLRMSDDNFYPAILGVYTFGCPRIGNGKFQAAYNAVLLDRTFTVINDCDIVPRVPGWLAGYRRPGRDEFISSANRLCEDPNVLRRLGSDIIALMNGWRACGNAAFLDELLRDHHIDNYIAALNAVVPIPEETK